MRQKIITSFRFVNLEAVIWTAGLLFLAFFDFQDKLHFSICPIKNLGFSFCPGCGLGKSISYLFRLEFKESYAIHPLGLIALIVLVYRVISLNISAYRKYKYHSSQINGAINGKFINTNAQS